MSSLGPTPNLEPYPISTFFSLSKLLSMLRETWIEQKKRSWARVWFFFFLAKCLLALKEAQKELKERSKTQREPWMFSSFFSSTWPFELNSFFRKEWWTFLCLLLQDISCRIIFVIRIMEMPKILGALGTLLFVKF